MLKYRSVELIAVSALVVFGVSYGMESQKDSANCPKFLTKIGDDVLKIIINSPGSIEERIVNDQGETVSIAKHCTILFPMTDLNTLAGYKKDSSAKLKERPEFLQMFMGKKLQDYCLPYLSGLWTNGKKKDSYRLIFRELIFSNNLPLPIEMWHRIASFCRDDEKDPAFLNFKDMFISRCIPLEIKHLIAICWELDFSWDKDMQSFYLSHNGSQVMKFKKSNLATTLMVLSIIGDQGRLRAHKDKICLYDCGGDYGLRSGKFFLRTHCHGYSKKEGKKLCPQAAALLQVLDMPAQKELFKRYKDQCYEIAISNICTCVGCLYFDSGSEILPLFED